MKNPEKNKSKNKGDAIVELKHLTWEDIEELPKEKTIFFLPISPMEEHGPHLPVGTDFLTAEDTAKAAIQKIRQKDHSIHCILLPSVPLGYCEFSTDFPGSFSVSSHTIKEVVYSFGSSLATHGFKYLVVCTYHMALGHLKGIYAAMQKLRKKYHMHVCEPWAPIFYSQEISKAEPKLGFETNKELHAGFRETSLMKYQYPYLVSPKYQNLLPCHKDLDSPRIVFQKLKDLGVTQGYIGNPSKADATYGRWFFNFTVDTYVSATFSLLNNEKPRPLPKDTKNKIRLLFWQ